MTIWASDPYLTHVAMRVVRQEPWGLSGLDVQTSRPLHHFEADLRRPTSLLPPLVDFKLIIEKAGIWSRHELLRNTPGSPSAKLLIAATGHAVSKIILWHSDALLRSTGANQPVLRTLIWNVSTHGQSTGCVCEQEKVDSHSPDPEHAVEEPLTCSTRSRTNWMMFVTIS